MAAPPPADITYQSGTATATAGTGTFTPGQLDPGGVAMNTAVTAFTGAGLAGNNSVSWNPVVRVSPASRAVAGS